MQASRVRVSGPAPTRRLDLQARAVCGLAHAAPAPRARVPMSVLERAHCNALSRPCRHPCRHHRPCLGPLALPYASSRAWFLDGTAARQPANQPPSPPSLPRTARLLYRLHSLINYGCHECDSPVVGYPGQQPLAVRAASGQLLTHQAAHRALAQVSLCNDVMCRAC